MTDNYTAIVLLNYKSWKDTIECLESIDMHIKDQVVVIADNNSGNDSLDNINLWINQRAENPGNKYVCLANDQNYGFSKGNNIAIKFAMTLGVENIWLLNNDTVINDRTFNELINKKKSTYGNNAIYGSVIHYFDEPETIQSWGGGRLLYFRASTMMNKNGNEKIDYIMGASILIPKSILDKTGLLDETFFMYWEDVEFSYRVKKHGFKIAVADNSIVHHKESASVKKNVSDNMFLDSHGLKGLIIFFRKYYSCSWLIPALSGLLQRLLKRTIHYKGKGNITLIKIFIRLLWSRQ